MFGDDALRTIQAAFESGRYEVTEHFLDEMRDDVLFFVDIESAMRDAGAIQELELDGAGNPKYRVDGPTTDGRAIGVVCSIRLSDNLLLITVYDLKTP